jgi:hypothetical protein
MQSPKFRAAERWFPAFTGTALNLICTMLVACLVVTGNAIAHADEPQWMTLPPTPTLPEAVQSGTAPVNDIKLWYATFGPQGTTTGEPVILLHGGLANANYWGNQLRALQSQYSVIVVDSRGHGRSTRDQQAYGYDLMASDVTSRRPRSSAGATARLSAWTSRCTIPSG